MAAVAPVVFHDVMKCHDMGMRSRYSRPMNAEALQTAALNVARALCPATVLTQIVGDLAAEPGVALARIWLMAPGDLCASCGLREECADRSRCLHLEASAGSSVVDPSLELTSLEGRFQRFPVGVRKVGMVADSGEALLLRVEDGDQWLVDSEWARREGIVCFAGQPLIFRGEVLGVLALFSREELGSEEFGWIRTFADHAATAIANRRAFQEVEELRNQLELERDYLREEVKVVQDFGSIVGHSPALQQLMQQVDIVAPTEATVLVEGESGTGKELIARALHEQSPRSNYPLVRVNCASIPHELFESEFFGHLKGSFTGAVRDRAGRFQVADGGTLFLDEVGEIPLDLQGKLLRALQEGQFSRVGEDTERSVDVRVIAATNRDLQTEVQAGRFREDLYYRLTVFPIRVPPLRERAADIPQLAQYFIEQASRHSSSEAPKLRQADLQLLQGYSWPGNIRELQNVIQRAMIGAQKGRLALDMPSKVGTPEPGQALEADQARLLNNTEMRQVERANLVAVLNHLRWQIAGAGGAAQFLGLNPATLTSRLKALGIERPRHSS
jgi:transcriptional regulator with GAF, ATPase, and Fis domain